MNNLHKYEMIMISTCINHQYIYELLESIKKNIFIRNYVLVINQSKEEIITSSDDNNKIIIINHGKKVNSSVARNIGIDYIISNSIVSDFVCFPDDDSSFDVNYFIKIKELVSKNEIKSFITDVYCSDKEGLFRKVKLPNYTKLSKSNFNIVGAVNILLGFSIFRKIGHFDERFGVNALYGAGEDGDYFLRGLNFSDFYYTKDIYSFHPSGYEKFLSMSYKDKRRKLINYGRGVMAMLNKHGMIRESLISILRAIGGGFYSFCNLEFSLGFAYLEVFFVRLYYFILLSINPLKK